jgi:localization factor PodJL
MRAELPWNVAGIPPEAREAARSAARREGLSVGEWLTRRILRSFSDMGEEPTPMPVDAWGLPASAQGRRDTEEMLARVSRTETEASDIYRRIEEQLRGVARRLDGAERSQSENNRVIAKTASEMNIAAREQAQAFDQLGNHVVELGDRLARVERLSTESNMKDAVKGLHQGLSRLADQISQTATQSANQVSALADNLEQLAGRLGQLRHDVEETSHALEQRVNQVENASRIGINALEHRLGQVENAQGHTQALEQRLDEIEGSMGDAQALEHRLTLLESAAPTDALNQALENIESRTGALAAEQAELQRREAESAGQIARLEDTVSRLESRGADPSLERRLDGIERGLGDLIGRLEAPLHAPDLDTMVRKLTQRLDSAEKQHEALVAELHANLNPPNPPEPMATPQPPVFGAPDGEVPPFAEPPPPADPFPAFDEYGNENAVFMQPPAADPFASGAAAVPDFPEPFVESEPPPADNFLSAARRSARAAAAQAEAAGTKSAFSWGGTKPSPVGDDAPTHTRLLIPGIIIAVILLVLITSFFYGQHLRSANQTVAPPLVKTQAPAATAQTPAVVPRATAPTTHEPAAPPAVRAHDAVPQKSEAAAPAAEPARSTAKPAIPEHHPAPTAHKTPAAPAPKAAPEKPAAAQKTTEKSAQPPLDRLTSLANGGNPVAETIVGLKYLDGNGVPANPAQAAHWLTLAAEHGQPVAQTRLGTLYEHGQGVPLDMTKAVHWYKAAAAQGNRTAMHNLAVALHQGVAGKPDKAAAARWFTKAASLGLVDSQFNLAVLYERGEGVPQSLLDAYKWYSIAAAQGDTESKARLAILGAQMSADDKAAAARAAAAFHPIPINRRANVPPTMADLPPG